MKKFFIICFCFLVVSLCGCEKLQISDTNHLYRIEPFETKEEKDYKKNVFL